MRIVFFGSPDFAQPSLKLINEKEQIIAVVSSPPKPTGRGQKEQKTATHIFAEANNIKVLTPANPNLPDFWPEVQKLKPDLFVVVSYGLILCGELLRIPKHGGINLHPSLLPKYRGAAPIQWTLIRGETITGVSIILMNEKMDAGGIIIQKEFPVLPDDNYDSLSKRLSEVGATIILEAIQQIELQKYDLIVQDVSQITKAPKIKKEDCYIKWNQPTNIIYDFIRGLSSDPAARTRFRDKEIKILEAIMSEEKIEPGRIKIIGKKLLFGTGDGSISILKLQPENKKPLSGLDFINGFRPKDGEVVN